jgi:hypothetical protein
MSQEARLLKALRKAGKHGVENFKFPQMHILRYSARIGDLRSQGFNIYCERVYHHGKATGTFKYYLSEEK